MRFFVMDLQTGYHVNWDILLYVHQIIVYVHLIIVHMCMKVILLLRSAYETFDHLPPQDWVIEQLFESEKNFDHFYRSNSITNSLVLKLR